MSESRSLNDLDSKRESLVHKSPSIKQSRKSIQPRFFVGIGASAGGLESLEIFFRHVKADIGLSFVVIQHLSPDFKSMMGELLARETTMRIKLAEEGDDLENETIYLIPPGKQMIVQQGCLRLRDRDLTKGHALPVDDFLSSLAKDKGNRAIAIILSGSGSDGSRGITQIHEHGGLVIAESLETAKFDGMPSSAQATGAVHLVLKPSEIPSALAQYDGDSQRLIEQAAFTTTGDGGLPDFAEYSEIAPIVDLFRTSFHMDFTNYRETTVVRRIRRRMDLMGIGAHADYLRQLKNKPEELHALYKDLLIGVTQFFRDPEVFQYLIQEKFSELISQRAKEGAGIRAWVAGCATGEEAYTIAISLKEAMQRCQTTIPVKLFATDVDRQSIDFASRGVYNASVQQQLPAEYLEKYFVPHPEGFQISPSIRKEIIFSPHNVLSDTPFTDLDFVSCRNLLIYFKPQAQNRAISLFHFSLRVGGVLLLGGSESTGALAGEFQSLNERNRVFQKKRSIHLVRNLKIPNGLSLIRQQQRTSDLTAGPGFAQAKPTKLLNRPSNLIQSVKFSGANGDDLDAANGDDPEGSQDQILKLRTALQSSRNNLESTIEELQASNEELQATNEELIASNEQLQSANEELHSLNEELYSVNAELQRKIEELAELNRDMNHLLENTNTAIIFLDKNLRIRRFTSQVSHVFDLVPNDIGRSIETFASRLKIENLAGLLRSVVETGEAMEQEILDVMGPSYLMKILPYLADGQMAGVVMMWIDISSLETLRVRLRWMSAIVESTSDAIIGQDLQGVITSWNRGSELLYGYSNEEVVGQSIDMLVSAERKNEVFDYRNRVLRGGIVSSVDTQRIHKDGRIVDVSLTVSPVFDGRGRVIGISKIARDITQRILLEQELQRQIQQRERFLAVLSHELRNPLNAVSSASLILGNARADDEMKRSAAKTIDRQVGIMKHLLEDLLDEVRIAQNKIKLQLEPVDLRDLLPAAQEMLEPELEKFQTSLSLSLADCPVQILGDPTRLIQIFVNLIQNAAKYSGSAAPIEVLVESRNDQVRVAVIDRGKGIPAEQLESIFEPFTQLERDRHRNDGGLGIGLSLTKFLVELHEGRIWAESKGSGQGSTFHLWFPKWTPESTDSEEYVDSICQTIETEKNLPVMEHLMTSPGSSAGSSGPQSLKIVIVEDNEESRKMLQILLELDGHRIVAAESGQRAIEVLEQELPDLALVDIGLPDISGYEVAKSVRSSSVTAKLFLVALTGYGQPSDIAQASECGFDQHLVKPVTREQLSAIIKDAQHRKTAD